MRLIRSESLTLILASVASAAAPEVTVRPDSFVLGTVEAVSIAVRVPDPALRLRMAANVGSFEGPEDSSTAEQAVRWLPPSTRFPMTAVLLFWFEESGGRPDVTAVRISLRGRTELQVDTEPGAMVRVQVGGASFGPKRADQRGRVQIEVEVPPGVRSAQVIAQSEKRQTIRAASLDVPAGNPLAAAITPEKIFEGEVGWLIAVHSGTFSGDQLEAEVHGGGAEEVEASADRSLYRISPIAPARCLSATVRLRDRPDARAVATAQVFSQARPPSTPPPLRRIAASALLGGFYAGGANAGLALALDGSYRFPVLGERLSLDLEIGFRSAGLSTAVSNLGRIDSTLTAVLLELAARFSLLERGRWVVQARLGGGVAPFWISARSDFQAPFTQRGLAGEGFAAAQVGCRLRELELVGELRGAVTPVKSSAVDARLGGLLLAIGARYSL